MGKDCKEPTRGGRLGQPYTRKASIGDQYMADAHTKDHDYHIIDPSPWPLTASFGALIMAFGGVGYEFNNTFSLVAGYRGTGVDYEDDNFEFDVIQHGPIFGGLFRF